MLTLRCDRTEIFTITSSTGSQYENDLENNRESFFWGLLFFFALLRLQRMRSCGRHTAKKWPAQWFAHRG